MVGSQAGPSLVQGVKLLPWVMMTIKWSFQGSVLESSTQHQVSKHFPELKVLGQEVEQNQTQEESLVLGSWMCF